MGWFAKSMALFFLLGAALAARAGLNPGEGAESAPLPEVVPASHGAPQEPSPEGTRGGEVDRPGREDPDEFYKKPPRKPKVKTRMYARDQRPVRTTV